MCDKRGHSADEAVPYIIILCNLYIFSVKYIDLLLIFHRKYDKNNLDTQKNFGGFLTPLMRQEADHRKEGIFT